MSRVSSFAAALFRRYSNVGVHRSFSTKTPPTSVAIEIQPLPPAQAPEIEDIGDLRTRLFRLRSPKRSAMAALDKWVNEGRAVSAVELRSIACDLRRAQRYKHALEISEWMKAHQDFEFLDSDYAMRIDLITRVFGVSSAEEFFEGLPSTEKFGEACTALLHSYARAKMVEKAESLFERIEESGSTTSILTYNEMMTLYMSVGELDKVLLVAEELKKKKVPLDLFTYNLWISACAATQDIDAVRKLLNEMANDTNSESGWITYRKLAEIYVNEGHLMNSDNTLVETGMGISQREWITYDFLIILHAGLGNNEKITEIWKSLQMTSQKIISRSYICVLSAYLVLGQLKEAGEVIDAWKQSKTVNFDVSACSRLLDAFMQTDSVDTAESLQRLMLLKEL